MTEICEKTEKCNIDQLSFKAYLARWLAVSAQLAPFTTDRIVPLLQHSASAAAQSCVGGPTQTMCGSRWWWNGFDGLGGVGQQMSALSVISANLIKEVKPPYTQKDGGTSESSLLPWAEGNGGGLLTQPYAREILPLALGMINLRKCCILMSRRVIRLVRLW